MAFIFELIDWLSKNGKPIVTYWPQFLLVAFAIGLLGYRWRGSNNKDEIVGLAAQITWIRGPNWRFQTAARES